MKKALQQALKSFLAYNIRDAFVNTESLVTLPSFKFAYEEMQTNKPDIRIQQMRPCTLQNDIISTALWLR